MEEDQWTHQIAGAGSPFFVVDVRVKFNLARRGDVTPDLDEGPLIEQAAERVDYILTAPEFVELSRHIETVVLNRAALAQRAPGHAKRSSNAEIALS